VILPGGPARVFVATKPVDFRKGLDGLSAVVQEQLKLDPFICVERDYVAAGFRDT
jgi:transposase